MILAGAYLERTGDEIAAFARELADARPDDDEARSLLLAAIGIGTASGAPASGSAARSASRSSVAAIFAAYHIVLGLYTIEASKEGYVISRPTTVPISAKART